MIAGYHTAGLLFHDLHTAVEELAQLGFSSVVVRPHPTHLNPASTEFSQQIVRLGSVVQRRELKLILDIDAPYFHDAWKHDGPALSASDPSEAQRSYDWVARWLEIAMELHAPLVTVCSGKPCDADSEPAEIMLERLASQCHRLQSGIDNDRVRLGLRPRSGDAIATVAHFERLGQWLGAESELCLAADLAEMLRGGELPLTDRLARNLPSLACVYLCDRKTGVGGDQPIGHGDVALSRVLRSLHGHRFEGFAVVRVEGHSELGLSTARDAMTMIQDAIPAVGGGGRP